MPNPRRTATAAGLALALGLAVVSCAADRPTPILAPGVRVRVTVDETAAQAGAMALPEADSGSLTGQFVALGDDALLVNPSAGAGPVRIPRSAVERLQVSSGRSRPRNIGIGAAIGLGVGLVAGLALEDLRDDDGQYVAPAVTTSIGALFGALRDPEHWRDVPLDSPDGP